MGDSVAVNGSCLTVEHIQANMLQFHVSFTTQERTTMNVKNNRPGVKVNLERAMKLSDRLGGHIVTGHIDGFYKIINIKKIGDDTTFEILIDKNISPYIVPKGSVTIDGISLTIANRLSSSFVVTVIPHTINNTNLKMKYIGNMVNVEVDIFARYIIDSKKYTDFI